MAKIIEIRGDVVSIGMDNGTIKEVRMEDISYQPSVGDEVSIYESETRTIVSKIEKESTENSNGGVHINVQANANNNASPVYVANGTKAVNKIVYCLLAFFLGAIGIHKFYAGKIVAGIVFVVFSWTGIPFIIALIDFIIGLCKRADANGMILV